MPKRVDHFARRMEIAEAAAKLVADGGLELLTFRELAATSGFSKGVLEHYFENKQALMGGALAWLNHCFENRAETLTHGELGIAAIRGRIEAVMPLTRSVRDEWKVRLVFWGLAAVDSDLRRQQAQRMKQTVELFRADLEWAESSGEIAPLEDVAQSARHLTNTLVGICISALHQPGFYDRKQLLKELESLLQSIYP